MYCIYISVCDLYNYKIYNNLNNLKTDNQTCYKIILEYITDL